MDAKRNAHCSNSEMNSHPLRIELAWIPRRWFVSYWLKSNLSHYMHFYLSVSSLYYY